MRKLTKSEYTPAEVRQELANLLQEKIDTYGSELRKLREREVGRTALAKGDLCLICAQLPAECPCLRLRKASAEEANREMKGFKSVASSPTFGGGSLTNAPKTPPRSGNGNRATSGVIPNAKAECGMGPKKFKIPGKKGGKLKKHTAAMPGADARPAASGVPGKQPVGQGGGDAFKVPHAATTASLNDVRQMAPAAANATKDKAALPGAKPPNAAPKPAAAALPKAGMHPDTKASLGAVQASAPKAAWAGAGLPNLKAKLQGVQAAHALAPKPAAAAPAAAPVVAPKQMAHPNVAAARAKVGANPATGMGGSPASQLAADKRAGGVGFLNNLISRFRRPAAAPVAAAPAASAPAAAAPATAPVRSQRFHGAMPLQRSEPDAKKPKGVFGDDKCLNCKKSEHSGMCKEEMPAPDEGMSSINHNRNMLRVGSTKARRGVKRKR
jgi:hypothetical protein